MKKVRNLIMITKKRIIFLKKFFQKIYQLITNLMRVIFITKIRNLNSFTFLEQLKPSKF